MVGQLDGAGEDPDDRHQQVDVEGSEGVGLGRVDFNQTDPPTSPDDRCREPRPDARARSGPLDAQALSVKVRGMERLERLDRPPAPTRATRQALAEDLLGEGTDRRPTTRSSPSTKAIEPPVSGTTERSRSSVSCRI